MKRVVPPIAPPLTKEDGQFIKELDQLIANRKEEDGSIPLIFTPGLAGHVIKTRRGTHNRNEKPGKIKKFASIMEANNWKANGSTISFDKDGLLSDGQNRFLACIRAGKPFRVQTMFGVDRDAFSTIDQGSVRSPVDVLTIAGVKNANYVAPAVRWAELLEMGDGQRTTFGGDDILDLYKMRHKGVERWLRQARAIHAYVGQPIGLVMALLYTFNKVDPDLAMEFAEAWAGNPHEARFAPLVPLHMETQKIAMRSNGRVHEKVRVALIINCWNAIHAKRKTFKKWELGDLFPTIK